MSDQERLDLETQINAHMDIARTMPFGAARSNYVSDNVKPLLNRALGAGFNVPWVEGKLGRGKYRLVLRPTNSMVASGTEEAREIEMEMDE